MDLRLFYEWLEEDGDGLAWFGEEARGIAMAAGIRHTVGDRQSAGLQDQSGRLDTGETGHATAQRPEGPSPKSHSQKDKRKRPIDTDLFLMHF